MKKKKATTKSAARKPAPKKPAGQRQAKTYTPKPLQGKLDSEAIVQRRSAPQRSGKRGVERRYLVKDATVEKLGELLNHETEAARWDCRDEVSGFLHTLDRPGHENDRAFYCEAWNGTSAYTYDRIGRGTVPLT